MAAWIRHCMRRLLASALILCVSAEPVLAASQPGSAIDPKLVRDATDLYAAAEWPKAIQMLSTALSTSTKRDKNWKDAQVLLLRCQVKSGDSGGARQTLEALVSQDKKWKPDPNALPADELASINQMLPEVQAELKPKSHWKWYAGGAAAVAAGVVVWCPWCPSHGQDKLPPPPPPPSGAGR